MLAPALAIYGLFDVYPKLAAVWISFYDWPGIGPRTWVGLGNYERIFGNPILRESFLRAAWHNLHFFAVVMGCYLVLGTLLALLLSFRVRGHRVYRLVFFLPYPLATVAIGFLWGLMLNPQFGPLNQLLRAVGLGDLAIPWLGYAETALTTIALINVWHLIGFPILLLLAGITSIRTDVLEAAFIDGSSRWQVIRHIVLPQLKPVYGLLAVLVFIGSFNTFELIYVLQGQEAGPYFSTDVLGTFFYRVAFGGMGSSFVGFGLGSAIAVVTALLILPASLWVALRSLRRD